MSRPRRNRPRRREGPAARAPAPPAKERAPLDSGRAVSSRKREDHRQPARAGLSDRDLGLAFLGLCGLLALAFFHQFVLRPGTMPFGTDMLEEAYPLRNFAVQEVKAGHPFPLWNPFAYAGIPFLETLPYPVYYPTSLLYFVMPLGRAIGWAFVLHFAAAGAFMYLFARRLGVSPWGAGLAGLSYMFNGYLVSHLYAGQDGRMFAMVLIPLVFACLRTGLDRRRLWPYLLMGGAVALQMFTPHVQIMYFSSLAAAAWFLVEAAGIWRREGARPALVESARFAAGFAFAAALGAVELLPTATFLESAVRGAESGYAYASSWATPPGELSALIAPDLVGSLQTYWGKNPFKLHTEYLGAVPLLLALCALLWAGRRRALFWGLLALVGLLFALGAATPVHRVAYAVLPMVKSFRAPSMMLAVVAFAVATLAGLGFDALTRRVAARVGERPSDGRARDGDAGRRSKTASDKNRRSATASESREVDGSGRMSPVRTGVLVGLTALLVLAWLLAVVAPGSLAALAGGLPAGSAADRASAQAAALRALPASLGLTVFVWLAALGALWWGIARGRLPVPAAAAVLAALLVLDLWRIDARYLSVVPIDQAFAPSAGERYLMEQERPFRVLPLPGAMGPNQAILHGLESVSGLQKFRLAWYDLLQGGPGAANLGRIPLWRVLNLRYVVSARPIDNPGLERADLGPPAVYRWTGEAPRAWVARSSRVVDDATALDLLSDPGFDVERVVLLSRPLPGPWGNNAFDSGASAGADRVRLLSTTPNRLEAEVTAGAPSLAVFSEAYHEFWEARVDGRPVPLARADLAFRAVPVPAGTHQITMEYRPRAFERGLAVSLAGLVAGLVYAGAALLSGRRRRAGPDEGTPAS